MAQIGQMAWKALSQALPTALVTVLMEKLVALIVPAAGTVMLIIEALQAAWGEAEQILQSLDRFMSFLKAVRGGNAGPAFVGAIASGGVAVVDFISNWLVAKLASSAQKVSAKLKRMGKTFASKYEGKSSKYSQDNKFNKAEKVGNDRSIELDKDNLLDDREEKYNKFNKDGRVSKDRSIDLDKELAELEKESSEERRKRRDKQGTERTDKDKDKDKDKDSRDRRERKNRRDKDNKIESDKDKKDKNNKTKDDRADDRTQKQKEEDVRKAAIEAQKIMQEKDATPNSVKAKFPIIKYKYKLTSLELIEQSNRKYRGLAKINPEKSTDDIDLNDGKRKPASIKKIFFASHADRNNVSEGEVWYGDWLLKNLNAFEPGLLDKAVDKRNETIENIRGKDETWKVLQGAIYAPFIEDNSNAIQNLQVVLEDCDYLLSLERGGSFLADQIARGKNIANEKIKKRTMSEEEAKRLGTDKLNNYKVQQQADLKVLINSLMNGKEQENITISIAETMVGGGSTNELIKTLEEILQEGLYPNIKFKLLLLQQTIHREDEGKGVILRKITSANQIQIFNFTNKIYSRRRSWLSTIE